MCDSSRLHQTGLFCLAAVVPQSKSTELCSLAAVDARRRHFIMTCDIYGTEINKLNLLCPSVQHKKVILGL